MSRWCQPTFRVLDAYGLNRASYLRQYFTRPIGSTRSLVNGHVQRELEGKIYSTEDGKHTIPDTTKCVHRQASMQPPSYADISSLGTTTDLVQKEDNDGLPMKFLAGGRVEKASILQVMDELLSPQPLARNLSISTLISLYHDSSTQGLELGPRRLEDILALCGTIAASPNRCTFDSRLKIHFKTCHDNSRLWATILTLAGDLERSNFGLSLKSRYWIMRAHLVRAEAGQLDSHTEIHHARAQYLRLKSLSNDPDAHTPLIHFLISSSVPEYVDEGVGYLNRLLRLIKDPHPRLMHFLWTIVLSHGSNISASSRKAILQSLRSRITFASQDTQPKIANATWAIQVSHLSSAFAAALFPSCRSEQIPLYVYRWAANQVYQALAADLPVEVKWSNLVFLAASMSTQALRIDSGPPSITASSNPTNVLWRTASVLKTVEASASITSHRELVQGLLHSAWEMFVSIEFKDQPIDIIRAYVSSFFKIAGESYDERIMLHCLQLSQRLALWQNKETDSLQSKAQAVDCVTAYAKTFVAVEGPVWPKLYSTISAVLQTESRWQLYVTEALLRYYMKENISIAYDLYVHNLEEGLGVRSHVVQQLLRAIVRNQRWDIAKMFLEHAFTARDHKVLILGESLRFFQIRQLEYVHPPYADLLAKMTFTLCPNHRIPEELRFPIRFFSLLLVRTQKSTAAVDFVKTIHQANPNLFPDRLARRLVLLMLARNDLLSAIKMFEIFYPVGQESASSAMELLRRRLKRFLAQRGAHKLTRRIPESRNQPIFLVKRDSLINKLRGGRTTKAIHRQYVRDFLAHPGRDVSTIREAVSVLVKARRFFLARKVFAKAYTNLDDKSKTIIGNILVHGPIPDGEFRNGRLVRHILKIKNFLQENYGFTPDRTTSNIIMKAILKWRTGIDAPKLRAFFDQLVRDGYPVPQHFRRKYGVPFETLPGSASLPIPKLTTYISYSKHVRPLYRLFMKAFHYRDDFVAKKTVLAILREVEIVDTRDRERRNRARREGISRKKRNEIPSGRVVNSNITD
ncbi:hypothetical protein CPC08DRAFT_720491 [Agrocybe pediades]|nr:hypothetical protein CPC08DRAFT_720491 [Agrocybe pediades]